MLWLWHTPAATALISPPAWEPPNATGVAQEKAKRQKKKKKRKAGISEKEFVAQKTDTDEFRSRLSTTEPDLYP